MEASNEKKAGIHRYPTVVGRTRAAIPLPSVVYLVVSETNGEVCRSTPKARNILITVS